MGGLNRFLSEEKIKILSSVGMHKIAAALKSQELGIQIDEIDLPTAVTLLATRAYEKRASMKKIRSGLAAFSKVVG